MNFSHSKINLLIYLYISYPYSLLEIISRFTGASGCLLSDFLYMINGDCLEDWAFLSLSRGNDYKVHSARLIVRDSN